MEAAAQGIKGRVGLLPWSHLEEVALVCHGSEPSSCNTLPESGDIPDGSGPVTEAPLGPLLPVPLFWFLSAERAGVTDSTVFTWCVYWVCVG